MGVSYPTPPSFVRSTYLSSSNSHLSARTSVGEGDEPTRNQPMPGRPDMLRHFLTVNRSRAFGSDVPHAGPVDRHNPLENEFRHVCGELFTSALGSTYAKEVFEPTCQLLPHGQVLGPHTTDSQAFSIGQGQAFNGGAITKLPGLRPESSNTDYNRTSEPTADPLTVKAVSDPVPKHDRRTSPSQALGPHTNGDTWRSGSSPSPPKPDNVHQSQPPATAFGPTGVDFSTLMGPGSWHDGPHEGCDLDAQHQHCPDGGVYLPSPAAATQMLRRARESLRTGLFLERQGTLTASGSTRRSCISGARLGGG